MNDELLSRYEEKQKQEALKMLKALERRIKRNELLVVTSGFWEGTQGKWNFNVVTRESDNFRPFIETS